jgi:hypothetical protein
MTTKSTGQLCGTFVTINHTKFLLKLMAQWSLTDIPRKYPNWDDLKELNNTSRYEYDLFKSYLSLIRRNDARNYIRSIDADVQTFYHLWTLTLDSCSTPLILGDFFKDCYLYYFFQKKEQKIKKTLSKFFFSLSQ